MMKTNTLRDTMNWLQNANDRLNELVRKPHPRPIDMTLEQKETKARLDGCALMYIGSNVYALCVDSFGLSYFSAGSRWRLIHRHNEFETVKA